MHPAIDSFSCRLTPLSVDSLSRWHSPHLTPSCDQNRSDIRRGLPFFSLINRRLTPPLPASPCDRGSQISSFTPQSILSNVIVFASIASLIGQCLHPITYRMLQASIPGAGRKSFLLDSKPHQLIPSADGMRHVSFPHVTKILVSTPTPR